jgi:hypothetical protein
VRVVDPHSDRWEPERDEVRRRRGRKKHKVPRRTIDHFLKVRFKVPVDEPDDGGRFLDDWAPNLRGAEGVRDEVEVTVLGWREHYHDDAEQPAYRVCVWGGDDLGYERDFYFTETEPTWLVLMVLEAFPEPLTKSWLRDVVGMVPA